MPAGQNSRRRRAPARGEQHQSGTPTPTSVDRAKIESLEFAQGQRDHRLPLRETLTGVFGERTFGESTKRLVITSFNLGSNAVYLFRTRIYRP
jgi:hypothetical protein